MLSTPPIFLPAMRCHCLPLCFLSCLLSATSFPESTFSTRKLLALISHLVGGPGRDICTYLFISTAASKHQEHPLSLSRFVYVLQQYPCEIRKHHHHHEGFRLCDRDVFPRGSSATEWGDECPPHPTLLAPPNPSLRGKRG